MELREIVPLGRTLDEYVSMFNLTRDDLSGRILGCADGPASFNAEMAKRGHRVTSIDPLYKLPRSIIEERFEMALEEVSEVIRLGKVELVWGKTYRDLDDLQNSRRTAFRHFIEDYEAGLAEGRYVPALLPNLDFESGTFDLALCSHFLFLYSESLTLEFHIESIVELMRVAKEVRIFPLVPLGSNESRARSAFVEPVVRQLREQGAQVSIEKASYHLMNAGDELMRIRSVSETGL